MSESRERALALALLVDYLGRERRSARTLLRAEQVALRALRAAVVPVAARAALAVAKRHVDERDAMIAVRRATPAMRDAVERSVLEARAAARRAGRGGSPAPCRRDAGHQEEDAAAAHTVASSYAAAWGAAAMAGILARREDDEGSFTRAFSPAPHDYRLRRIAATETARAYNDERISEMRTGPPTPGTFMVWSAVLDRRTCAYCFDKDGRTVALHESFGATPPVHVCCRCTIEFVHVPRPERLEDIEIDYDAFKREMRDVIRERRVPSERHAGAFVRASMGRSRSPVMLTRKFAALGR